MIIQNKVLAEALKKGEIVIMPTDTVYGIVGSALSKESVEKIFKIKNRIGKLGTILFADKKQLIDFGFDAEYINTAMKYWPGPVSVVLPAPADKKYLAKGWNSLAVRIPEPNWLHKVLLKTGPLATTSANLPDEPTVTTIQEANSIFGDKVALYVDGGELSGVKPSTIIRITDSGKIEKLR